VVTVAAAALLVLAALGVIAFRALEPTAPRARDGSGPVCAPKPCTAPSGFEVYVRNVNLASSRVTLDVSFTNNTQAGGFEAVSYRHTSVADFSLTAAGNKVKPVVDAGCPRWEEARVERGASAGPDKLCLPAPVGGLTGALLEWTPDTGVFPVTGTVPLG
jgi:hypothetical protein